MLLLPGIPFRISRFLNDNQDLTMKFRRYFNVTRKLRDTQNQVESFHDICKYLAIAAQNNMKNALIKFCEYQITSMSKFPLVATGTTSNLLY